MKTMKTTPIMRIMKTLAMASVFFINNIYGQQISQKGVDYSCINGSTKAVIAVGGESQEYLMSQVPFKIRSQYGGVNAGGYLEVSGQKIGEDRDMYHCDDNNLFLKVQDCNNNFFEYNVYTQKALNESASNWVFIRVTGSNCAGVQDSHLKYGLDRIGPTAQGGFIGYAKDINYGDLICVANIYDNTYNWLADRYGGTNNVGCSSANTQAFSGNCYEKPSYKQFPMWTIMSASGKTGKVKYGDDFYLASGSPNALPADKRSLLQVSGLGPAGYQYNTKTTFSFFHKMDGTEVFKAEKTKKVPSGIQQSRAAS